MSKYRELIKGDIAPKSALNALSRRVAKNERLAGELHEVKLAAEAAAATRDPWDTFVTRAELRESIETGELPEAWTREPEAEAD